MPRRINIPRWPLLLLLAGLTLAAYWPILGAGFIYDDRSFVTENQSIRSWENIPAFFTDPVGTTASIPWPGIWRPLRGISYLLDYTLWGLRPLGYHLTSLVLHYCNGLLLAALVAFLLESELAGMMASLAARASGNTMAVSFASSAKVKAINAAASHARRFVIA